MTRTKVPITLVVPDASPLVTLGRVERLDVLSFFTVPIDVVDVVAEEARRPKNDVNGAVRRWWDSRPNNVHEIETLVGDGLKFRRARGEKPKTRGAGELAVEEYASMIASGGRRSDIPLVLFEDPNVLKLRIVRLKNVHLMNTAALLINLQQLGVLPDGREILDKINVLRKTPMVSIDLPAKTAKHQSVLPGALDKKGWER